MNFAWRGSLGKYRKIREIIADPLVIFGGRIACAHEILNQMEILAPGSVEMMVGYEYI